MLPFFAVALFGAGLAMNSVGFSVWAIELFSAQYSARVLRQLQLSYVTGSQCFNLLPGASLDYLGSYRPAFAVFTVCAVLSIPLANKAYQWEK